MFRSILSSSNIFSLLPWKDQLFFVWITMYLNRTILSIILIMRFCQMTLRIRLYNRKILCFDVCVFFDRNLLNKTDSVVLTLLRNTLTCSCSSNYLVDCIEICLSFSFSLNNPSVLKYHIYWLLSSISIKILTELSSASRIYSTWNEWIKYLFIAMMLIYSPERIESIYQNFILRFNQ